MRTIYSILVFIVFIEAFSFTAARAQNGTISGTVRQDGSSSPVAKASVFLSNSSFGTATGDDGGFVLRNVKPGQYTLIVTILGYEDYRQVIAVNATLVTLSITLKVKAIPLAGITISAISAADRKTYLKKFIKEFIGQDDNAGDCKIINPEVLHFQYQQTEDVLTAYTHDFLIIENKALGYRIKFLVDDFKDDNRNQLVSFAGKPVFEELPGSTSQQKKWTKNRNAAYFGSAMHFYRSLYQGNLAAEGFQLYRLTRENNPDYRPLGNTGIDPGHGILQREISLVPQYIHQKLDSTQLEAKDVLRNTDRPDLYALTFSGCLYIVYTKKKENPYLHGIYRPVGMPSYATTIATISHTPQVALFDRNGSIISDPNPLYEGAWSTERLSQLLPVDFTPARL